MHIGSAEKDHQKEDFSAIQSIIQDDERLAEQAIYGFNKHLELLADFWDGILLATESVIHQ